MKNKTTNFLVIESDGLVNIIRKDRLEHLTWLPNDDQLTIKLLNQKSLVFTNVTNAQEIMESI